MIKNKSHMVILSKDDIFISYKFNHMTFISIQKNIYIATFVFALLFYSIDYTT